MAHFILMYTYGPGPMPTTTPEEAQKVVATYTAWTEQIAADGRLVSTSRLSDVYTDPGRVCTQKDDDFLVTDGPFAETKEVVGGYAVIEATDYDEAASLCREHPATHGAKVVIRQFYEG